MSSKFDYVDFMERVKEELAEYVDTHTKIPGFIYVSNDIAEGLRDHFGFVPEYILSYMVMIEGGRQDYIWFR